MAVIGPMRKLTIGNKTYQVAAGLDNLPIASASTLGGIKVGTGLTIDSTTGVLSATGTDVTIDNAISGTSTNPVQNKVIKEYVDGLVAGVLHYKGTKATTAALPSSGNVTGDVWHVTQDGGEYAWDGNTWQELGTVTDLSGYMASADYPDLTAIEGISATSGLLKKTAANTWTLDTSTYLTSFTETDPVYSASAAAGITSTDIANWNGKTSNVGTVTSIGLSNATNGGLSISGSPVTSSGSITVGHSNVLSSAQTTQAVYPIKIDKNGHISEYGSAVSIPTKVSDLTNDSGFITSYTETDPIFTASAAAGITSSDITNWNNKVSDDKTWNGIALQKTADQPSGNIVIPYIISAEGQAKYITATPNGATANILPKYDANGYLKSTTPSANDNSTKVATTAYVDTALASQTETDPVFSASVASGITSTNLTNWNTAYTHATELDNLVLPTIGQAEIGESQTVSVSLYKMYVSPQGHVAYKEPVQKSLVSIVRW